MDGCSTTGSGLSICYGKPPLAGAFYFRDAARVCGERSSVCGERSRAEPTLEPMGRALDSRLRRALCVCLTALAAGMLAGAASARAGTQYVDGISDQGLPAWDGSFPDSSFARSFRATWLG